MNREAWGCLLVRKFLMVTALLCLVCGMSASQTLTTLKHQPPDGAILTLQLTDGTVMAQGNEESDWWKLTPDDTGSYVNGT